MNGKMMNIDHSVLSSLMDAEHPFGHIDQPDIEDMMANYLAMSQAFPYLQAGSQKDLFYGYLASGKPIDRDLEVTTIVGNFLSWDETGGLHALLRKKMAGVSDILNTDVNFHSNILQRDLDTIFGHSVIPKYSENTRLYLEELLENLSSADAVERCATMVSFEIHANQMITSLWGTLITTFPDFSKSDLRYFFMHVGGDDPAEKYHVEMTEKMISIIVDTEEKQRKFINHFEKMYRLHINWCAAIALPIKHASSAENIYTTPGPVSNVKDGDNVASFADFERIHIHTGEIVEATLNPKARVPAYILKIDFGDEIGIKVSSAQLTENYRVSELVGKKIVAIINFENKNIAGVKSEVLVLATVCENKGTLLLEASENALSGSVVK